MEKREAIVRWTDGGKSKGEGRGRRCRVRPGRGRGGWMQGQNLLPKACVSTTALRVSQKRSVFKIEDGEERFYRVTRETVVA